MAKDNLKTFVVSADVHVSTDVEVRAKNLEEAIEQARTLKVTDFVTMAGNHSDSRFEISGLYDVNGGL